MSAKAHPTLLRHLADLVSTGRALPARLDRRLEAALYARVPVPSNPYARPLWRQARRRTAGSMRSVKGMTRMALPLATCQAAALRSLAGAITEPLENDLAILLTKECAKRETARVNRVRPDWHERFRAVRSELAAVERLAGRARQHALVRVCRALIAAEADPPVQRRRAADGSEWRVRDASSRAYDRAEQRLEKRVADAVRGCPCCIAMHKLPEDGPSGFTTAEDRADRAAVHRYQAKKARAFSGLSPQKKFGEKSGSE